MRGVKALLVVVGLLCACARPAGAVCVTNTQQLRDALSSWQNASGATITIKLAKGTYAYPNQDYWSQVYYGGDAPLQLLGGYDATCTNRTLDPTNTTLDGQQAQYSTFQIDANRGVLVEGITFTKFGYNVSIASASSDSTDSIVVRYVIGTDLYGSPSVDSNYGGFVVEGHSNMRVESSLFYNVYGGDTAAALEVTGYTDNSLAVITNVTIVHNTTTHGLMTGCHSCSGSVLVYNTLLYDNGLGDLDTRESDPNSAVTVAYSNLSTSAGAYSPIGNFKVSDPKFENPTDYDFKLTAASTLLNKGAPENIVPGGYGSQDIDGGPRVVGSHIDLGAYESSVNDVGAQAVTSTLDNPYDPTLRTAIDTANLNANANTITFALDASPTPVCPQVITLSTPLPDITTDVTIDGFSEAGASANTQYLGYDGRICVILRAANSAVDHALAVTGSGRLTVKGVEFEGFSKAGVILSAGNGSIVAGNGFAARPGAPANGAGVRVDGTANHSLIGALSPNDRNVFDQGSAGVDFESNGLNRQNVVEGNWFGFNFDGTPWTGAQMTYGIYVLGSGGNTIGYNSIGNLNSNGIRLTGANTTANTIISNGIGVAPDNSAAGNGNSGIGIAAGAHGNVIGTASYKTQSGGGNYIKYNFGPGVWVESNAGTGNRIDGNNAIYDNSGLLPIDLAGLGPSGNDSGDVDTGANNLQNYPFLSQATRIQARTIVVSGFLQTQTPGPAQDYRLDVFWTDTCTGSGADTPRGEMKRYVGYFFAHTDGTAFLVPWSNHNIYAPADIPKTGYLFATATDAAGNTSEPGKCFTFFDDYIFADGFGSP